MSRYVELQRHLHTSGVAQHSPNQLQDPQKLCIPEHGNQKVETRTKFVRCGFPNMAKKRQERDGF